MLSELGLRVQLGHDGRPCPCPSRGLQNFLVFDLSGAHPVNADYCNCNPTQPLDRRVQLLRKRWFPATFLRPQTVFTFDLLETFHELTLQAKTNPYDFYHTIIRKTDNANLNPSIVGYFLFRPPLHVISYSFDQYRYPEMHRAFHLWRNLMALKRAGMGHNPSGIDGTPPGALTVECPACPHPNRNIPTGWENSGPLL